MEPATARFGFHAAGLQQFFQQPIEIETLHAARRGSPSTRHFHQRAYQVGRRVDLLRDAGRRCVAILRGFGQLRREAETRQRRTQFVRDVWLRQPPDAVLVIVGDDAKVRCSQKQQRGTGPRYDALRSGRIVLRRTDNRLLRRAHPIHAAGLRRTVSRLGRCQRSGLGREGERHPIYIFVNARALSEKAGCSLGCSAGAAACGAAFAGGVRRQWKVLYTQTIRDVCLQR